MAELTLELMLNIRNPQETAISPDGRLIAFTVAPLGRTGEHDEAQLWMVPADASKAAQRFTTAEANERHPRWSPAGDRLAFLSDRVERGVSQIHQIAVAGGESVQLTSWKGGVEAFEWSPSGSQIAVLAADEPSDEDERRKREKDDAQGWGEDWRMQRVRLLDPGRRTLTHLDTGAGHVRELAWSPAGDELAVIVAANPELDTPAAEGVEIRRVALAGGPPQVVARIRSGAQQLTWSRDGAFLAFTGWEAGRIPSSTALFAVPSEGGRPRCLTDGQAGCVLSLQRPADAATLICSMAEGLRTSIYAVDVAAGTLSQVYRPERGNINAAATSFSVDGATMATVWSSGDQPPEVWAGAVPGPLRCLTGLHPEFEGVNLGCQEEFHWTARDGLPLDGILILPPDRPQGPLPAVILVHGGPYGRSADSFYVGPQTSGWAQLLATQGFAVCLPNPRGGQGHGHHFAATVAGEVGHADYEDVMAAADALIERGIAEPSRLGIGGWSQGGFMTAWAVTQTHRFRAGVMGAGVSDWGAMVSESDLPTFEAMLGGGAPWDGVGPHHFATISPLSYAAAVQTPVLILHGERDARVPLGQARGFFRALRAAGVPVEFVTYPREPHGVAERLHQRDILRRVLAWYTRWLIGNAGTSRGASGERQQPAAPPSD